MALIFASCSSVIIDTVSSGPINKNISAIYISSIVIEPEYSSSVKKLFAANLSFSLQNENFRVETLYSLPGKEDMFDYHIRVKLYMNTNDALLEGSESLSVLICLYDVKSGDKILSMRAIASNLSGDWPVEIRRITDEASEEIYEAAGSKI